MSTALIVDIETNGLLSNAEPGQKVMDRIHCIVTREVGTGVVRTYHNHLEITPRTGSLQEGALSLTTAAVLIGHNIVEFDLRAIKQIFPQIEITTQTYDTLICARLIWPDIKERDLVRAKRGATFPMRLVGKHSLEAWGHRLGVYKGDFAKGTDWAEFTQEMLDYCVQDTLVTANLWEQIAEQKYSQQAIKLEHDFSRILGIQERHGFLLNKTAAEALAAKLTIRRHELNTELVRMVPPFVIEYETPKKKQKKTKTIEFNPQSRDHIAKHLMERRGWKPTRFTSGEGKPQVDEEVLAGLDYPEAKVLNESFMVQKRLGQLAEGKQAWLRLLREDGRIHGRVNHNGAVTGRCTHSNPNVTQVPSNVVPYGKDCRALFTVPRGFKLVGADASGLELRCLAHFMARYDGGAYAKIVTEGDPHTVNKVAAGLSTRDEAKRFIYAWLYGGGPVLLGAITGTTEAEAKRIAAAHPNWLREGKRSKLVHTREDLMLYLKGAELNDSFLEKMPALAALKETVTYLPKKPGETRRKQRPTLRGLDGRVLSVRHMHAALNTLLQSAGAVVMKLATVILRDTLAAAGLLLDRDYWNVAHVHDEIQLEVPEAHAEFVGKAAVAAIRSAGEVLGMRCRLDGAYKVGNTWAETH